MLQLGEYSAKYESLKNEYVWGVRRTEQTYKSVGLSSIKPSRPSTIEEFEANYGLLEEIIAKIK